MKPYDRIAARQERRFADLGAQVIRILSADNGQDLINRMDEIRRLAECFGLATIHNSDDDSDPYLTPTWQE